jgi:hypothetical protein
MAETYDLIVRGGEVVNHAGRGPADVGLNGFHILAGEAHMDLGGRGGAVVDQ